MVNGSNDKQQHVPRKLLAHDAVPESRSMLPVTVSPGTSNYFWTAGARDSRDLVERQLLIDVRKPS